MNRLSQIAKGEDKLVKEINAILDSGQNLPLALKNNVGASSVRAVIKDFEKADKMPQVEAVVLPFMRPVLFIKNGQIELPESNELKDRLIKYKPIIEQPLRSVGRIELKNHQLRNLGTGWLISDNIIVTNRHVAEFFAMKRNTTAIGAIFKNNFMGVPIQASIDFKEEYNPAANNSNQFEVKIDKIVYLADVIKNSPDLALLRIKTINELPEPVAFLKDRLHEDQLIGIVGYPFQDPRGVTDREMEMRIFSDVFGVKRYAPGQIIGTGKKQWYFLHDASTLGGNSGSLVQDMESGLAIGLHFSGVLLQGNYAVKGEEILEAASRAKIINIHSFNKKDSKVLVDIDFVEESPFNINSYSNRSGYDPEFLDDSKLPLPTIKNKSDILKFGASSSKSILKYTHFSVAMSKSRRICFYSAVNIDGKHYKRIKRTGWRLDPRIPAETQIMKECYGNSPKFSRGHMTRREDPNWGDLAQLGNDDTMHVTNTVPQMQPFNAGVWLTLENYALENSKKDKQKISVFTGPFLRDSDPVKFGVKIPVEFWKIIAFIHDETNQLCATGYTISQEDYLRNDEFVFGQFKTYQVPIRLIEKKTGITFGPLSKLDPLKNDVFESISSPLLTLRQIKFY